MRKWFLVLTVTASMVLGAVEARAETLADALIAAYRNSNLLDQNRAVLRAADEDMAVAVAALMPVISYTIQAGLTRNWTDDFFGNSTIIEETSASLTLSGEYLVLDFGRRDLGIDIAKGSVLATRHALVNVEQQVLLAAVQAYVEVRLTQEIIFLRQSNVRLITQELRAAQDRFDVGEVTRTDVAIAQARLAAAQSALAAAEGDFKVARESYKAATGAYPGKLAALPPAPKIGKTLEAAQVVARKTHPLIRQAQELVTVAEKRVALADAAMKPTLGLGSSVTFRDAGDITQQLGLTWRQTIYAGGELSALYRKALAGQDQSRASLGQTTVAVLQNVGNAWANLAVYAASIEAGDQQIRAAQTAFDGVREEATLGARTTLDVLNAEQELLDARAARLQAEAGRYLAVYQVLSSMGLLTVDHLNLGIATYDPEAYFNAVKDAPATSSQGKRLDRILEKIGN
ncbi:MAG: TolC family outer membrane protein [Rhodobacter sp.]|nr:TolC family outer membrane protein [Rhodobacter sp.]